MSLIGVINDLGEKQFYYPKREKEQNENTIGIIYKKNTKQILGFINMTAQTDNAKYEKTSDYPIVKINVKNEEVEPMISFTSDHIISVVISGPSGVGKSIMGNIFFNQYVKFLPKNETFLISQKPKDKDRNYKKTKIKQLSDDEIASFNIENHENSLFIIDDFDFGDNTKDVYKLINNVSTLGRELQVSFINITHIDSNLGQNKAYKEARIYVCYNDNMNEDNLMLTKRLMIKKKTIENIKKINAKYYVFYKEFRTLLTDKEIIKY